MMIIPMILFIAFCLVWKAQQYVPRLYDLDAAVAISVEQVFNDTLHEMPRVHIGCAQTNELYKY